MTARGGRYGKPVDGDCHGDARDALLPFQRALAAAEIQANTRFAPDPLKAELALSKSEWQGLHMAVEAQVVKAALDKKPLDKLVWEGLLTKLEKFMPLKRPRQE